MKLTLITAITLMGILIFRCAAEEGLVGHWPLDSVEGIEVRDLGPNQLKSIIVEPEYITLVNGRNGKAIDFHGPNGKAAYIRVDGMKNFDFSKGMTVMCWYKPSDSQERGHQGMIVCNGRTSNPEGFRLLLHYRRILLSDGKLAHYAATTAGKHPLKAGIWVHIAATYDGETTFQLFIDGEPAGTCDKIPAGTITAAGPDSLAIGSEFGYRPALATLSDIKLYERKLSIPEIIAASRKE